MIKKLFSLVICGGLLIATVEPAHATGPTQKVSNVVISASGVRSGELSVSWTVPSSFDPDFASYLVILRNSEGVEVNRSNLLSETANSSYLFSGLVNGQLYKPEVVTNYVGGSLVTVGTGSATPFAAPDAPAKPTLSRSGVGELFVDWDAPANNGNAISGYTIACVPACSISALTSTNSQINIAGLNTATSYTVTVVATNERGNSPASVASNAITPHAEVVAPTNLVITPGDNQIGSSWTAPTISGATITGFSVQLYLESAPANAVQTKSVTTPSTTFTGLTNGQRYFYKVSTVVGAITSAPATSLVGLTSAPQAPAPPSSPPSQITGPSNSSSSGSNSSTTDTSAAAPAPAAQPTSKVKQKTVAASLATQIGMTVTPKAKVTLTVAKASKTVCKVSGGKLVALRPGNCSVTVSVTPAKTKAVKKPKATKQSTVVSIS